MVLQPAARTAYAGAMERSRDSGIQTYEARRAAADQRVQELETRSRRLSWARGLVFAGVVAVALIATEWRMVPLAWILLPLVAFFALVALHSRTIRRQARARRVSDFYTQGLARLHEQWIGTGITGDELAPEDHRYAEDLDLFGRGSLFELLCTARTVSGERTLARWLLEPAERSEVIARQEAVDELRERLDLREAIALVGDDVRHVLDPSPLESWAAAPPAPRARRVRWFATALSTLTTIALIGWWGFGWSPAPALLAIATHGVFTLRERHWVDAVASAVSRRDRELQLLAELIALLESESFEATWLSHLQKRLASGGPRPSEEIDRLRRLSGHLDSRHNMLFAPIAWLLNWGVHVASSVESWRQRVGAHLPEWFAAVGSAEALLAMAAYAYEHPEDPFPDLGDDEPRIEAHGLVHPLLPASTAIRNDLTLDPDRRLLIVSGSNMSGKSTLLRSLGTNVVLAMAGAPVRAHRMTLTPLAVGASIGVSDSLLGGRSRFFAEISRLKRIVDACDGPLPVLFLLDELFGGTNSHDRRIGAELLLKALLDRGAIGLVTTHDLALAPMAEALGPAANVHFSDQLDAGELAFDYRLRPGTVTHSNALALMRAVGLPVPESAVDPAPPTGPPVSVRQP